MDYLVQNEEEILESMLQFRTAIEDADHPSHDYLVRTLSGYKSWYVYYHGDLKIFSPSKVTGHKADELNEYCKTKGKNYSGKQTEDQLQNFFDEVTNSKKHGQLLNALTEYLAKYGKKPNSATRFNVISNSKHSNKMDLKSKEEHMVDLLHTCFLDLSEQSKSKLRRLIG